MNRAEARRQWQRIADGDLSRDEHDDPIDLNAWVRAVAAAMLQADDEPDAGRRPGRVLEAAGLGGRDDPDAGLREHLELMRSFPIVEQEQAREARRGEEMALLIQLARLQRPGWSSLTDDEVRKRVTRILGSSPKV